MGKGVFKTDKNGTIVCDITPLLDTWRFIESKYKAGVIKAIGISNFNIVQIQDLYEKAEIKPQNLQVFLFFLSNS